MKLVTVKKKISTRYVIDYKESASNINPSHILMICHSNIKDMSNIKGILNQCQRFILRNSFWLNTSRNALLTSYFMKRH